MDWLKIGSGILLVAMFFFILPSAKRMVQNSPKGSISDWMGYIVPIGVIALFVVLLIALV
ncbi:MAG: hypothetical protein IIC58_06250 [Proteobacteria bacterium]|nr:hypothetical protein [Pseudomonadota bacterium]